MWSKITCRKTGESQIVASLDGIDTEAFDIAPMGRAPRPHEVLDADTGKLRDHRKDHRPMPQTAAELEQFIRSIIGGEGSTK